MVGVLFLKVFDVALLLLHFLHLGLDLLLEALAHLDDHEHQDEQAQDADHDVQLRVLLADAAGVVRVLQVEAVRPGLEIGEGTGELVAADGDFPLHAVVDHLDGVRQVVLLP